MRAVVLGASGAVGRSCVAHLLAGGNEVLALGRDHERVAEACPGAAVHAGLDLERVVADPAGAAELLSGADVVVSCVGPSHRYAEPVARMVLGAGVPLVDPGAEGLVDLLDELATDAGVSVTVGAGVQPGLTGLAVAVAAVRLGPGPQRLHGWCGGLQPLTPAGVEEYLEAALAGGRSGQALVAGRRVGVRPEQAPPPPPPFDPGARSHPHLDEEAERAAVAAGADHLVWGNVTEGPITEAVLGRCLSGEAAAAEAIAAARTDLFGREPRFHILVEALADDRRGWARVSCSDSYAATGAVAAAFARRAQHLAPGARLASTVEPVSTWQALADELDPVARLESGTGAGFGDASVEEGEL